MHPYVPFLFKMPRQTNAFKWEEPFGSVFSQDLILSFLRGELREPGDVVEWLKDHRDPGREVIRIPVSSIIHHRSARAPTAAEERWPAELPASLNQSVDSD